MKIWPVQDGKAFFSEFLETCLSQGPQLITKCGSEAAVPVPIAEWRPLHAAAKPSLGKSLLSDQARSETVVAPRGAARRRKVLPSG